MFLSWVRLVGSLVYVREHSLPSQYQGKWYKLRFRSSVKQLLHSLWLCEEVTKWHQSSYLPISYQSIFNQNRWDGLNNRAVQMQQHVFHRMDSIYDDMTFKAVKKERIIMRPNINSQICSVNASVIRQSFNSHSSVINIYLSSQSIMKIQIK